MHMAQTSAQGPPQTPGLGRAGLWCALGAAAVLHALLLRAAATEPLSAVPGRAARAFGGAGSLPAVSLRLEPEPPAPVRPEREGPEAPWSAPGTRAVRPDAQAIGTRGGLIRDADPANANDRPLPASVAGQETAPALRVAAHVPMSFEQGLMARRGASEGRATWAWERRDGRYVASLRARVGGPGSAAAGELIDWTSLGTLDASGVSPDRFVSRPQRGGAQAVNFQRDAIDPRVTFSGPTGGHALAPGAQDRLSWLVQLMAILRARSGGPNALAPVAIWVAGPRGDGEDWVFHAQPDPDALPGAPLVRWARLPKRRFDLRVDVWLDPAREHRLARLRLWHEGSAREPWELWDPLAPPAGPGMASEPTRADS